MGDAAVMRHPYHDGRPAATGETHEAPVPSSTLSRLRRARRVEANDNLILGSGLAWTPIDSRQLLSFQIGASYEIAARDVLAGSEVTSSGGDELLVHPTVVWGTGPVLVFAVVSLPVYRDFRNPVQQDRWRAGVGITYVLGT